MKVNMKLLPQPFTAIKNRQKRVEIRLNDEKRKNLKIGDIIFFTQTISGEVITAKIVDLRRFETFIEMSKMLNWETDFGIMDYDTDSFLNEMHSIYTKEQEALCGVLAIYIEIEEFMEEKIINKLVRDNIPQIIEKNQGKCFIKILEDEEYLNELTKKLKEEIEEFFTEFDNQNDENAIKELADVCEVAISIAEAIGVERESFERIREAKRAKNGGFERRIFLEKVVKS